MRYKKTNKINPSVDVKLTLKSCSQTFVYFVLSG